MRKSFKSYVEMREKVDEGIMSSLGYAFDRWGTPDPAKIAAADAIDKFGRNYIKNKEYQTTAAKAITSTVGSMPGKNIILKKSSDDLNKHLGKVGDDWEDVTQAAYARKVPVRSTVVP